MNCERCQELISELVDGSLGHEEERLLETHLAECSECLEVRRDLESIVGFCQTNRGEYVAPANERALWLRIRNTIEAENPAPRAAALRVEAEQRPGGWLNRTWQLSFPQLAAAVAAIVLVVSLTTVVGLRRIQDGTSAIASHPEAPFDFNKRNWQQQQTINYWNARIEVNRARWSPQMRDTFDRNLNVIDQAVNDSLRELGKNPHDEVSEEMLNAALNEKISLLKEFSEL